MAARVIPIAGLQALLEYGAVSNATWWTRAGRVGDNLLHWATTHPLEVVLMAIGTLFLYKLLKP